MEDQGQHDMAAQQAAARDYQPVLEVNRGFPGSLKLNCSCSTPCASFCFVADRSNFLQGLKVGNKILSDAITNEYAKADPVYVEKTIVR